MHQARINSGLDARATPPRPSRSRRIVRAIATTLAAVLVLILLAAAATQTPWFKNWLRGYVVRETNGYLNGELFVGALGGNLFTGVTLEHVRVSMAGKDVVSVKDVAIRYSPFEIVSRGAMVSSIRLTDPVVHLTRDDGEWSIGRIIREDRQEADREGPARPISIGEIAVVSGSLIFDVPGDVPGMTVPRRIEDLDADFSFKYEPVRYTVDIDKMSFRSFSTLDPTSVPVLELDALSGTIAVHDDEINLENVAIRTAESSVRVDGAIQHYLAGPSFKLHARSDKLSFSEIGRIVPALSGQTLRPSIDITLDGPLDHLEVSAGVRSPTGDISGSVVADMLAPEQSIAGTLSLTHVDLAPVIGRGTRTDLTGVITTDIRGQSFADLNSLNGTIDLASPRSRVSDYVAERIKATAVIEGRRVTLTGAADAYGASSTVKGKVTLPHDLSAASTDVTYDVNGGVRRLNLARLPRALGAPPASTNLNASYRLAGTGTRRLQGDLRFEDSQVPGALVMRGSTVAASARLQRSGFEVTDYRADMMARDVDLEHLGRAFDISALSDSRYKTNLNGHLTVTGRGTSLESMSARVAGGISNSMLAGGQVTNLDINASVDGDSAHVTASGSFEALNPAAMSAEVSGQLDGHISGSFDIDTTIAALSKGFAMDRVSGSVDATLLPSQIAGVRIDAADVSASYDDGLLTVSNLSAAGPDVLLEGYGALAIENRGESHLWVTASSTDLDEVGKIAGVPISGIGKIEAVVTGNREKLTLAGMLSANNISYGGNSALVLSSEYKIDVPDMTVGQSKVDANTTGTFVTLGGHQINEISAKTTYEDTELAVDVTAVQRERSMTAVGTVLLRADERELRLTRLDLATANLQWTLAPGTNPIIRSRGAQTEIGDLRLVSGGQEIAADGVFGGSEEPLTLNLTNVDLAGVDALLLRPPQFSGAINASATVSGTEDDPHVKATFSVNQGGFRQFHYESFTGDVDYDGNRITLSSQLEQNPNARVQVSGYAPISLLKGAPERGSAADGSASAAEADRVDLRIESSEIDLGVVQGFTTALTDVTGTAQANIQITGTGADPHVDGVFSVANASLKVQDTGVPYAHVNGRIEVQDDRLHVADFTILDLNDQWLSLTGDISISRARPTGVSLQVTARDFKVLDNDMGNVHIDSDLTIAGDLRAPRIDGDLGVSTGTINLDPVLALTGESAYATTPTDYATGPAEPAPAADNAADSASVFNALEMDVRMTVPDDLVLKGSDLRAPGAPIGLGSLNVTFGGDLRVMKGAGDRVRLVGTVNTVRGTYDFQGRQFTILRDGLVRFEGTDEIDPTLDIRTRRVIQGVEANANIRGTLQRPRIELTSVPPLEQADVLSLIVFNQPVNQLGEGQQISLGQRAEQMAVGAIAGELSKSLGGVLNLSEFEIQAAPESGAGAELTVGQQVGRNLYVKLQQGIGDVHSTNFVLEYELAKWLRLQTNFLQSAGVQEALFQAVQDSGFDLIFIWGF